MAQILFVLYYDCTTFSNRQMILKVEAEKEEKTIVTVGGRDTDGLPFSFFKEVLGTAWHSVVPNFLSW